MKAIIFEQYGSPDVLKLAEMEKPVPKDHQVLIKVRAAAMNPADDGCVTGAIRFMTGLFKPKHNCLGLDVAGQVEAVGPKVTQFKPGDEVFGAAVKNPYAVSQTVWLHDFGSFAEYTISHEGALALKPDNLTFEQAAAVPCAALTAFQGLHKYGKIQPGQKVLISSATGGIGTFAVQIAKAFGAEVTGVCSTKNVDLVRSIGADRVIDYTKEDYIEQGQRYDLIFDSIGDHSLLSFGRILNPGGKVAMISARNVGLFSLVIRLMSGIALSWFVNYNCISAGSKPRKEDLTFLNEWLRTGKIKPVIVKTCSFAEIPEALRYVGEGHVPGKIVITF